MVGERHARFRRRVAVGAATAGIVAVTGLAGGAAYAYWTSHGNGSGASTTSGGSATVHVVAVTGGNNPLTRLTPGQTAELVLEVNNPNSYPVTIVSLTQAGDVTPSGETGPGAACDGGSGGTTGVSVPTQTMSVAVGGGAEVAVHIPGGASMDIDSASGCQGGLFQIPVTVTVQR